MKNKMFNTNYFWQGYFYFFYGNKQSNLQLWVFSSWGFIDTGSCLRVVENWYLFKTKGGLWFMSPFKKILWSTLLQTFNVQCSLFSASFHPLRKSRRKPLHYFNFAKQLSNWEKNWNQTSRMVKECFFWVRVWEWVCILRLKRKAMNHHHHEYKQGQIRNQFRILHVNLFLLLNTHLK